MAFDPSVQAFYDRVVASLTRHQYLQHVRTASAPDRLAPDDAKKVRKALTTAVEREALRLEKKTPEVRALQLLHLLAIRANHEVDGFVAETNLHVYRAIRGRLTIPERRLFRFLSLRRRPTVLGGFDGVVGNNNWLTSLFSLAPPQVRHHFFVSQFIRPRERGEQFWAEADARCRRYVIGMLRLGKQAADVVREGDPKGQWKGEMPIADPLAVDALSSGSEDATLDFLDARRGKFLPPKELARLTSRQRQIVELRHRGMTWTAIGDELQISRQTTKGNWDAAQRRLRRRT